MTITAITEIPNPDAKKMAPIKEKQDIYIPDIIDQNISRRNGMIYALCGSGGSGKSNLLLNLFKSINAYKRKFHNIYYFCPESSFRSVAKHPFEGHNKVYHELDVPTLMGIFAELNGLRESYDRELENPEYEEPPEISYNCVIIDDFADRLKDNDIMSALNQMLIKARHLCCGFFFTLQAYIYFPLTLRKQLTYITMFKPKNKKEFESICGELFHLNKDDSLKLYNYVYDAPYTHIDLDTVESKIYKNFNLLDLTED